MSGTTPNYSWPYPTGTDSPPDVAGAMQALAVAADSTVGTLASGFTTVVSAIGRGAAISNTPGSGTTSSATPANIPAVSSFSFTKKLAGSKLLVAMGLVSFSTAVDTTLGLGVLIAGTDTTITQFRHTTANEYRQAFGVNQITGVAAGAQTIQGRWFRVGGAGTLTLTTVETWLTMVCIEIAA